VFSVDGYSGVVTNGSLDSLVLTEMANDDDLFDQRFMENEMLYYAHEAQMKPPPRVYQILVDASASMRGARAVFARGLAIALAKKMTLLGFDASTRSTYFKWKKDPDSARLGRDKLERLSYVFGIYKALQLLLPEPAAADGWKCWAESSWTGRSGCRACPAADCPAGKARRSMRTPPTARAAGRSPPPCPTPGGWP
jgi:hypothetical protein